MAFSITVGVSMEVGPNTSKNATAQLCSNVCETSVMMLHCYARMLGTKNYFCKCSHACHKLHI